MKPTLSVRQTADMAGAIRKAVESLTEKDVYIGVPAEDTERGDIKNKSHGSNGRASGGINNAELSYIHEFGAPAAGIPARPHLLPGVEDIIPEAAEELKAAAKAALDGKAGAVDAALTKIGLLGQNAVRAKFQDNDWPPLKAATLDARPLKKDDQGTVLKDKEGKALRGKSRRDRGKVNPLIDTGQLMKSHTFVIRKRQGGDALNGSGLITPTGGSDVP